MIGNLPPPFVPRFHIPRVQKRRDGMEKHPFGNHFYFAHGYPSAVGGVRSVP